MDLASLTSIVYYLVCLSAQAGFPFCAIGGLCSYKGNNLLSASLSSIWASKLAQPAKYRIHKGCAQRPVCWDDAS